MSRTPVTDRPPPARRPRPVSRPHDPAETQADRAAEVVARGGSVSGWSFGSVPPEAAIHRDEKGAPATDEEKLKEAAKKAGEAALETKAGKALQEKVKETPVVKEATKFLDTTTGKVVAGGAIAAGVGGLAAAKQPLPFQAPAIPLDKVTPGLSAKVTVEGPVNAPTFVGLSLTYKEQVPKGKGGPTEKEQIAADIARLRAQQDMFKPRAQKQKEQADEQAAIASLLAQQSKRFGTSTLLPVAPGGKPKTVELPTAEPAQDEGTKKEEETPVQREPATQQATQDGNAGLDTSGVDAAVRGGGRPLDPSVRRSMEARFGWDFGSVRVHDDPAAVSAADELAARAFTVGEDIVFGSGGYDPRSPAGRHVLAHELAHVVQQRGARDGRTQRVQRRGFFESLGVLLGLAEGTWSDQELHAYLEAITTSGKIDGSYDSDNKARAIVRRWKQSTPGYDLLGPQKALLIDEMLDGPTLDDDEQCILDLLELSDSADLRAIFAQPRKRIDDLDSNLHGDEQARLDAFVAARFHGGRAELQAGRVQVVGSAVPAGAPAHGFDPATLRARLESDRTPAELIALIDRFSAADKTAALDFMMHKVWPESKSELGRARTRIFTDGVSEADKTRMYDETAPARQRVRNVERVLMHLFLSEVPTTADALKKGTKAPDPALRDAMKNVLRPYQYAAEAKAEEDLIELDEPETEAPAKPGDKAGDKKSESKPEKKPDAKPEQPVVPERAKFHDPDKYRAEVEKDLPGIVEDNYKRHVTDAGPRAGLPEIEAMAVPAKKQTDAVYGQFYDASKRPELKGDRPGKPGKLHFWYDRADTELKAMDSSQKRELARSWLLYYFQSDSTIRLINDKYSASPSFDKSDAPTNDEAKILVDIAKTITAGDAGKDTVLKLIETRRNWGGMAIGSQVFVDLFHNPDVKKDRKACWGMFQTLIHEYLHTLAHHDYETYAKSFGGTSGDQWNTLIEGVDCVLGEVVWAHVLPKSTDKALRVIVEGKTNAELPPMELPYPGRYPSYEEALRLVSLVGIKNVYAAYFLGLVDRIKTPKAPKPPKPAKGTKGTKDAKGKKAPDEPESEDAL